MKHLRFVAVVGCLLASSAWAQAGSCTFEGTQSDSWALAGNWQDSQKPGAGDDVVVADGVDCGLDEDAPNLATLTVGAGATLTTNDRALTLSGTLLLLGTLNTGASTITVTGDLDFDGPDAVLNPGTGTFMLPETSSLYLGEDTQSFYDVECAYAGKTTTHRGKSLTLGHVLTTHGGTLASDNAYFGTKLTGTSSAPLVLGAGTTLSRFTQFVPSGDAAITVPGGTYYSLNLYSDNNAVSFDLGGDVSLAGYYHSNHASFELKGKTLSFNSNDFDVTGLPGSRKFILFDTWGNGSAQWGSSTVTVQFELLINGSHAWGTSDHVEHDLGSSVWTVHRNVTMSSGNGTDCELDLGTATLNLKKSFTFTNRTGWTLTGSGSRIILDGVVAQSLNSRGLTLGEIEISNVTADVTLAEGFECSKLTAVPGANLKFAAGKLFRTAEIDWQGVHGNPITLRSTEDGSSWDFLLTGASQVSYADVMDSDATGGPTVYAGATSTDSGNNINWAFADRPPDCPPVAVVLVQAGDGGGVTIQLVAYEPDGEEVTFTIDDQPSHGAISEFDSDAGTLTYTPDEGFRGADSFTYYASDGANNSNTATVKLLVDAKTFVGTVSDSWADSENWWGEIKPAVGSNDNVHIRAACVLDEDAPQLGELLIGTGGSLSAGSRTIELTGDWTVEGSFDAGTSTVEFVGSPDATIHGAATFYNLTVGKIWDTLLLGGDLTVENDLIIMGSSTLDVSEDNHGVTVGGDFTNYKYFKAHAGTVTLNGAGEQAVSFGVSEAYNLVVENAADSVSFAGSLTANMLDLAPGASVVFDNLGTYTLADLDWNGSAAAPITLRSNVAGEAWSLVLSTAKFTHKSVLHVDAMDSDASGGAQIVAAGGTDSGNTTNWVFLALAHVAVTTPETSVTSPAWVEGDCGADVTELTVSVNGGDAFVANRENPVRWFADNASAGSAALGITLAPDAATAVALKAQNDFGDSSTASQSITWTATDLAGCDSNTVIRIRKGDSLLLAATDSEGGGTTLEIDGDGDGTFEHSGDVGVEYPHAYSAAGTFLAKAEIDGLEVGSITVIVISIDLKGPIACEVGYQRTKPVLVSPATEAANVIFTGDFSAAGPNLELEVSVDETTAEGADLYLKALKRGTPVLYARLSAGGPVIARQVVDEFTLDVPARAYTLVFGNTGVGSNVVTMRPYIPELRQHYSMFASEATFAGGATSFYAYTSTDFEQDFDEATGETVGRFTYEIEVPEGEDQYCFTLHTEQASSPWVPIGGEGNINGEVPTVELRLREQVLVEGSIPEGLVLFGEMVADEGKKSHLLGEDICAEIWLVDRDGVMPGKSPGDQVSPEQGTGTILFHAGDNQHQDYPETGIDTLRVVVPTDLVIGAYDAVVYVEGHGECTLPLTVAVVKIDIEVQDMAEEHEEGGEEELGKGGLVFVNNDRNEPEDNSTYPDHGANADEFKSQFDASDDDDLLPVRVNVLGPEGMQVNIRVDLKPDGTTKAKLWKPTAGSLPSPLAAYTGDEAEVVTISEDQDELLLFLEGKTASALINDVLMDAVLVVDEDDFATDTVTMTVNDISRVDEDGQSVPEIAITSDAILVPFDHKAGERGGAGGFGGPPANSGMTYLQDSFRIEDFVHTSVVSGPDTLSLTIKGNVNDFDKNYNLTEGEPQKYSHADDYLAIDIKEEDPTDDTITEVKVVFVVSTEFGALRTIELHETGADTNVFRSRRLQLEVSLDALPSDSQKDTITATLITNLSGNADMDDLEETENDSLAFTNEAGTFTIRLIRLTDGETWRGAGDIDNFTAVVTSQIVGIEDEEVDVLETGNNTLEFRTDEFHNSDGDSPPSRGAAVLIGQRITWFAELDHYKPVGGHIVSFIEASLWWNVQTQFTGLPSNFVFIRRGKRLWYPLVIREAIDGNRKVALKDKMVHVYLEPGDQLWVNLSPASQGFACIKRTVVKVEFQNADGSAMASPHRVGRTNSAPPPATTPPTPAYTDRTQNLLRAVVEPAFAVDEIGVGVGNGLRISNIVRDGNTITFSLAGLTQSTNRGDRYLFSQHTGSTATIRHPVSVVIPHRIGTHPTHNGPVTGVNKGLDGDSMPAHWWPPNNQVLLATVYVHSLNIPVVDQWGDSLGSTYEGAAVRERLAVGLTATLPQKMTAGGYYVDVVGYISHHVPLQFVNKGGNAHLQWLASPRIAPIARDEYESIRIWIDGYDLNPSTFFDAISNRRKTLTVGAPHNLSIGF